MIRTERLTKRFGELTAVDSLDLEVREGEILALLGPNGAGKTTTIRMLAALVAPTSGEARIGGHRLGEADTEIRRTIGLLTEVPGLYEGLSARQNLEIYGRLHGLRDVPAAIEKYLKLLGLWDRRNERAGTFSKGMKQKLAIARALIHEPRVLFLDEPTSGLDPHTARSLREFILSLRGEGRTIVVCTHNLDEAERLCDRVAILRRTLVALGEPAQLKAELASPRAHVRVRAPSSSPENPVPDGSRFVERLRAAPFVQSVELDGTLLSVGLEDSARDVPRLVRRLVELDADVLEVSHVAPTLEDIYLRLLDTGEGA